MSDRPNLKMTHEMIDYFIEKKVDFKMESYLDDESGECIQFTLNVEGIPDFAIFYAIDDDRWSIASIYELLDPTIEENFYELKKMFEANKGIFEDFMAIGSELKDGVIREVHLHSEFEDSEFSLNKLDEIYDYLMNKTEFAKELASISRE